MKLILQIRHYWPYISTAYKMLQYARREWKRRKNEPKAEPKQ